MNVPLAASTETGSLGIMHLKRLWSASIATRTGRPVVRADGELDHLVVQAMGVTLHQVFSHLYGDNPTFEQFEQWIVATAGRPDALQVERLNAVIAGSLPPAAVRAWIGSIESAQPALTPEDLAGWEEHGYVVLKDAIPEAARAAAEEAIWRHVGATPDDAQSWYRRAGPSIHGIMVELVQHPALQANRRSARIHKAFAQLWGTADLWVTSDRCGFHPPQRPGAPFPGPDLHWDCDLSKPREFGTQGILYLTDTPPEQGAFTVVPGFQRWGEAWLKALPHGADPRQQDLYALGPRAIGGRAGDLVIWHQALPHGASPNRGIRPRMVQYVNMFPTHVEEHEEWI